MLKLKPVKKYEDIPTKLRGTPIGSLLEYHNLSRPFKSYDKAQMMVCMCMDNRKHLHMPDNFSFIIRTGGANLRNKEFKVSFAVAIGGVRHIALIGHTHCGMVHLAAKKKAFIEGLHKNAGWPKKSAEEHFEHYSPQFEIHNEMDFIWSEAKRIAVHYPKVTVVPMIYRVEDNRLYLLQKSR